MAGERRHAWGVITYGVAACAVIGVYFTVPSGPLSRLVLYNGLGLSSLVVMLVGIRRHAPRARAGWYVLAVGLFLYVCGDLAFYTLGLLHHGTPPFPSVADALYLSSYPVLVVGLTMLVGRGRDRASLLDALIIATGAGTLAWIFLITPNLHQQGVPLAARLISISYPAMDVLMLGVAVHLTVSTRQRSPAFCLLSMSITGLLVADIVYAVQQLTSGYHNGDLTDLGWMIFYAGWGAAALHPSMTTLDGRGPDVAPGVSRFRLALLAAASLMAPATIPIQLIRHAPIDLALTAGASAALFLLVLTRLHGAVRDLSVAVARNEAAADRERALRRASAALVAANGVEAIHAALLRSAVSLVADDRLADARIVVPDGSAFRVAASTASEVGERIDVDIADVDAVHARFGASAGASVFVATLVSHGGLRGHLVLTTTTGSPIDVSYGLEVLASQTALALESAALTEDMLRQRSEAHFRSLVQHSSDIITILRSDGLIRYQSPSVTRILGYGADELLGRSMATVLHPDDAERLAVFLVDAVSTPIGTTTSCAWRMQARDGEWRTFETVCTNLLDDPDVAGLVLTSRDVTDRTALERQLEHQAFHDPLTGLANRALFANRVEHALVQRPEHGVEVAVLFLDLDDFKTVNDGLGHSAGDRLLSGVADRLVECLRPSDTAARLGGDEFAVLLEDVPAGTDEAVNVAQRIIAALATPFDVDGHSVTVRASIGVATAGRGGQDAETLHRGADLAMYMAKAEGKGGVRVYEPAMHEAALSRLELVADLRHAIDHGELVLHYQPIVDLRSDEIVGVEALVRWMHPERGLMPPGDFIALAEETGLIVPLGGWVLTEATRACARWNASGRSLFVSVNVSPLQADRADLGATVNAALARSGLPPSALLIEITENVLMREPDAIISRLEELRAGGVRVALDDFGTGYSSLGYLHRLPVDILKIDRTFIEALDGDDVESSTLARAILKLGHTLQVCTLAEGVERPSQVSILREFGCQLAQGFLLAAPVTEPALQALLGEPAVVAV